MKTQFKRVIIKPYDRDRFELAEDFHFFVGFTFSHSFFRSLKLILKKNYETSGELDIIKKGFVTDGASVPRLFWSIYPPFRSKYLSACVIHDYLCIRAYKNAKTFGECKDNLQRADNALFSALRFLNVSKFTSFTFWLFCSLKHKFFSYYTFKRIKEQQEKGQE